MAYGDKYPNLKMYAKLLSQRPSVIAAFPPHWVGTPDMDRLAAV